MTPDTVRLDTQRFGTQRFDTQRSDTQRFDTVPFDTVPFDTVPFDTVPFTPLPLAPVHPDPTAWAGPRSLGMARPDDDDQITLLLGGVRLGRTGAAEPHSKAMTEHLAEHIGRVGHRPRGTTGLVEALGRAGLTGYGGAHVPTATKWRSALAAARPLVVVANGAESEPLSAKDATLLRQRPHLVLDGLALAAEALGARRAVLWLHAGDTGARAAIELALAERLTAGSPDPRMEVVIGPDHYLSGESSAIARALAGGPALPTARRPAATHPGAPRTLVHNVETLARVALIARGYPPVATTLLTVLTPVDRLVLEVPRGTPVTEVMRETGWMRTGPPQALLLGGFGGSWAPWRDLEHRTFDEDDLRAIGLSVGAGVVAPIPSSACGVAETAAIAGYLAAMSARQCGPCHFGLPALADSMARLADGDAPSGERTRLLADLRAVAGRGACHHPDGVTRLVASAITTFESDTAEHAAGRLCGGARRRTLPVPEVRR